MTQSPSEEKFVLDPARSVLVVVDVENEFAKPGGKMYPADPKDQARTKKFIGKIEKFVQKCRENEVRIIYVDSIRAPDAPQFRVFGGFQRLQEGTWHSAIIDEIRPQPTDRVVPKRSHDVFAFPLMDRTLEEMGLDPSKDKIILTGGGSSGCFYDAIIGFAMRHYEVVAPVDCTYGGEAGEKFLREQMADPAYSFSTSLTSSEAISFKAISFKAGPVHVELPEAA